VRIPPLHSTTGTPEKPAASLPPDRNADGLTPGEVRALANAPAYDPNVDDGIPF
jgi:hypothetical protein